MYYKLAKVTPILLQIEIIFILYMTINLINRLAQSVALLPHHPHPQSTLSELAASLPTSALLRKEFD